MWLSQQNYKGVTGVYRIKATGSPAFTCAITIGTHGKEVNAGLEAWRWILINEKELKNVDLFVVLVNEKAAIQGRRFSQGGTDMNRLPESPLMCSYDSYEHNRAWRIHAVLGKKCAYILDLHTTDGESEPAGLGIVGSDADTNAFFGLLPVASVLSNVGPVQKAMGTKTQPFSGFLQPKFGVEVELGQTDSDAALELAPQVLEIFLKYIGVLAGINDLSSVPKPTLKAAWSVMAPSTDWKVADSRLLNDKEPVAKGDVLLVKGDQQITAPDDGFLLWGPSETTLTDSDVASEIWFAAKAVN